MGLAAIPYLIAAQIGQAAYSAKREGDRAATTREDAQKVRDEAKAAEKAKAQLLRQGVQETATTVQKDDPNASTGGVEMSGFKKLSIGGGTGANV